MLALFASPFVGLYYWNQTMIPLEEFISLNGIRILPFIGLAFLTFLGYRIEVLRTLKKIGVPVKYRERPYHLTKELLKF